jgi:hypothetical protein
MRLAKNELTKTAETRQAIIREAIWDGIHVEYNVFKENFDASPLDKSLPDSVDPCPRWGIVIKGQIHLKHAGKEEIVKAGDAYYCPPEHTVLAEAGTEVGQFGPANQLKKTVETVRANMDAFQRKEAEQQSVTSVFFPNYIEAAAEPKKL